MSNCDESCQRSVLGKYCCALVYHSGQKSSLRKRSGDWRRRCYDLRSALHVSTLLWLLAHVVVVASRAKTVLVSRLRIVA